MCVASSFVAENVRNVVAMRMAPIAISNAAIVVGRSRDRRCIGARILLRTTLASRRAGGTGHTHNFVIEGPGVSEKFSSDLTRGDTGEITVTLAPGSYTIYCPVDGHRG